MSGGGAGAGREQTVMRWKVAASGYHLGPWQLTLNEEKMKHLEQNEQ
jgi:hypothetical protein